MNMSLDKHSESVTLYNKVHLLTSVEHVIVSMNCTYTAFINLCFNLY